MVSWNKKGLVTVRFSSSGVTGMWLLLWLSMGNSNNNGNAQAKQLKYIWGDAFDDPLANGPDGNPYPWDMASNIAAKQRHPRVFSGFESPEILSPKQTREILLKAFEAQERDEYLPGTSFMPKKASGRTGDADNNLGQRQRRRQGRGNPIIYNFQTANGSSSYSYQNAHNHKSQQSSIYSNHNRRTSDATSTTTSTTESSGGDPAPAGCVPSRLCASTYNTTAPLYGVSLTSGQPVTIVQKFPDLLQQVVFQVCKTSECEVLQGECVQTYLPYLFLVIPLGPVTLTGQDYVLVESGCVCRPKYARRHDEPPPLPFIQPLH